MATMSLMMRIGAVVDGTLDRALGGVNRDMDRLDTTTAQLTARQQRLGAVMARALQRPNADLGRLQRNYQRITRAIEDTRQAQERLNRSIERGSRIGGLRDSAGGSLANSTAQLTAFALPVGAVIKQAAEFQDQLTDLAITGNWSAQEQMRVGMTVRDTAVIYNQTLTDINSGLGTLVAGGIGSAKELEIFAPKMTRIATAWRTSFEDVGNTALALQNNLGVTAEGFDRAMNMLGYAGKAGQFEARDMAKWLPSLTPFYQSLGIQGEQAVSEIGAAMQVARMGAGSSDEAANNYRNFMVKLTDPSTLDDFEGAGIDLKKSMINLVKEGLTPMGAMMGLIEQYIGTKSPKAASEFTKAMSIKDDKERQIAVDRLTETYKLGELFQDQQALSFIRPMIANKDEFNRIKLGSEDAASNDGIDNDFNRRMSSPTEQFKKLKINATEVAVTIGSALLPAFNETLTAVLPLVQSFAAWARKNPELITSTVKIIGGLLLAKVAFFGVSFAVLSVLTPVMSLITMFNRLREGFAELRGMAVLGRFAPMLARLSGAIRMIGTALRVVGMATVANPLFIAIGLLAVAAYLIYRNWAPIKAFFLGLWNELTASATRGINAIKGVIANFRPLGMFSRAWGTVTAYFGGLSTRFRQFGVNIIQGLISGVQAKFGALKATITNMGDSVSGWFKSKLGINSPSKVFAKLGGGIPEGTALCITHQTPLALKASEQMAKRLAQTQYSNSVLGSQSLGGGMSAGSISFSPTINVQVAAGAGDVAGQVQQGLNASYAEFERMLEQVEGNRQRRAFA